jgi:hypothetical protein
MKTSDQVVAAITGARTRTGADNLYYVCGDKPFIALLIKGVDGKNDFEKLHEPKDRDEAVKFLDNWKPKE